MEKNILQQATPAQLEKAAADNHIALFGANAIAGGGEVVRDGGIVYTYAGTTQHGMLAFPVATEAYMAIALNRMMDYYRTHIPNGVGCWSLDPVQPPSLGVQLLARGFQPGWQPCWMALDLEMIDDSWNIPEGLEVQAENHTDLSIVRGLPNAGINSALSWQLLQHSPEQAQQFVARLHGNIVGHSCVLLSTGEYGVAGIYNVGVLPKQQNQGIGKAVVIAACRYAKEKGYRYAVLNATGKRMYEQIGFRYISHGLTWWLMGRRYITHPPSPNMVAIAEAVGYGNIAALEQYKAILDTATINEPLCNRMTLMQLAVHCKQPASGEWLVQHGAVYSVLDAWDMGWQQRAAMLLYQQPTLVNERYDHFQYTLLHIAADRNDIELARLALTAHPDLTITDNIYKGTAQGWAEHLQRREIAELISSYTTQ